MIGHYLRQLENLTQFQMGVSSMFFLLFVLIVFMVIKGKKTVWDGFGDIPLDTENENYQSQEKTE